MTVKEEFINYVETNLIIDNMPEDVLNFWNAFKSVKEKEVSELTDSGKNILRHIQKNYEVSDSFKTREVADGMGISSRMISGAMRKLVSDNFIVKVSQEPVVYAITKKGKEYIIEETNE